MLLTVAKARRVHPDGLRFQGLHYLDLSLAAFVGQEVTVRYDPRDVAEIRVFHQGSFLCRAICPELAGQTVELKEIVQASTVRQRKLREELRDRAAVVDDLLALRRSEPSVPKAEHISPATTQRLKRYLSE